MDKLRKKYFWLGIMAAILIGSTAKAATIEFEPSQTSVAVGDSVAVKIYLNTEGANINAVDLGLLYPGIFSVKNVSKAGSFIQIWIKEPGYTKDTIFLSGGSPGGVNAVKTLIATINLQAKAVGDGALGLSPASSILLNDGSGTPAQISLVTPTMHVTAGKTESTTAATAKSVILDDKKPPAGFDLIIGTDPKVFKGKYFVSFFTTDSQSGIDHYEIKEGSGQYAYARSPYLLNDQSLHSVIKIRAYDSAGNYREETYPGIWKRFWWWITSVFKK